MIDLISLRTPFFHVKVIILCSKLAFLTCFLFQPFMLLNELGSWVPTLAYLAELLPRTVKQKNGSCCTQLRSMPIRLKMHVECGIVRN